MNDFEARARHRDPRSKQRIAVVTMGVKLGNELKGYTRFRKISEVLVASGFEVDLITTTFQHWEKAQRNTADSSYTGLPYNVVFIEEPGYAKNLDLKRVQSHRQAARNLAAHFAADPWRYHLIYAEIPPNDVARAAAEAAEAAGVPFVADINDLWPEAMRMALDIPVVSDVAFRGFARDARKVYQLLDAAVGTSEEYAARPAADRSADYPHITVYVGNDLAEFDAGVAAHVGELSKPAGEVWVAYAGTLGASYDIATLLHASAQAARAYPGIRLKILGDGPDREPLEQLAGEIGAPAQFLGYVDYAHMAAWLAKSDIVVNSLVKGAPQSIPTKIGDYLASGKPLVNTGESSELRNKVALDGVGVNVDPGDPDALCAALCGLARNASARKIMGSKARRIAEIEFDQNYSYQEIVHLVKTLLA